jgi:hypothetical protein
LNTGGHQNHRELRWWWRATGEDMVDHKLRPFLWVAAIITIVNGISYTLVPQALLPTYGVQPTAGAILGFRFLGCGLLTFGLILFFLRKSQDWASLRGLLIGASVGNIAGVIVSLWATLTGVMNGGGWLFIVTYAVLLAGYLYFLITGSQKHA